ncbi:hypothetical protein ACW9HK_32870, partial [Nocardia gipuzkoensis]
MAHDIVGELVEPVDVDAGLEGLEIGFWFLARALLQVVRTIRPSALPPRPSSGQRIGGGLAVERHAYAGGGPGDVHDFAVVGHGVPHDEIHRKVAWAAELLQL